MNRTSKFSLSKLIFSIVFNAAILVLSLLVFKPFFEEIDDTQICMIAEGAFGSREWHLIYANFILGKLYVLLGSFFPMIRWHIILQYVFIYLAYVLGVYVISKHRRGLFISVVAVLSTFYELYVSIQYTKTASFVCAVGFILVFEYVRNRTSFSNVNDSFLVSSSGKNKGDKFLVIFAFILVIYGALLRPESFFIAAVPTVAVGFLELARTRNIRKYIIILLPLFALVMVLKYADTYMYSLDQKWADFMKYNRARMELNDYRYDILDFSRYSEELTALDVSENDALAILTYQYGDDNVFSYERFREIRDAFPTKKLEYKVFANLFENLIGECKKSFTLFTGMMGLICVLFASIVTDRSKSSPGYIKDSMRKLFSTIGIGFFCGMAIVYFQYSGRYSHRLIGALIVPTIFVICYMIDSVYIKDNDSKIIFAGNKNDITMAAGILMTIILIGLNGLLYKANKEDYKVFSELNAPVLREMDEISRDEKSLYVGDTFTFQNLFRYEVFNVFETGSLDNFVTCGSWYLNSPITKAVTQKFGYNNPFDALRGEAENVYLLDNNGVKCKTLFLNEHYDIVYEAQKVDTRGEIDVYKIVVSE